MRRAPLVVVAAVILGFATRSYGAPPSSPSAPSNLDEARVHFGRGVQLYREGDFRAALAEFNRANDLGPSYRILYNIGQVQLELRDYPSALQTFARYLKDGGTDVAAEKRDEVAAIMATCAERVAEVTVHVNRADAELFVDDVSLGKGAQHEPVIVGAGRRRFSARVRGLPPAVRVIELAGADHVTVELQLDEPVAHVQAAPTALVNVVPSVPSPSRTPFWVSLAVTSVLGAATVTSGVLSLSAKQRLDDELDRFPTDDARTSRARTSVKTMSLATDALGLTTLLGVGVTTYFALTTFGAKTSAPSVRVGVGPGTVAAGGTF